MRQLQHGDVLFQEINVLPKGVKPQERNGVLIVARGEATGHNHVITQDTAVLWELKGELYLEVGEVVVITHEEHKPMPIPTGIYKVGRVQEYDYFEEMARQVRD